MHKSNEGLLFLKQLTHIYENIILTIVENCINVPCASVYKTFYKDMNLSTFEFKASAGLFVLSVLMECPFGQGRQV